MHETRTHVLMLSTVNVGGQFSRSVERYIPRWTHDPVPAFSLPSDGTHCRGGKSTLTGTCGRFSLLPPRNVATSWPARPGMILAVNFTIRWSSNSIS